MNYIIASGIPIVSANEALNKTGNIIQVGDYIPDNYTDEVFVIGSDGSSIVGRKFGNYVNTYQNTYTLSMNGCM